VTIKNALRVGLALSVLGVAAQPIAHADEGNKKTILTFSQPVEIAGHVLPAGTYTFQLADSSTSRHIVQIFNADGTQIIATVLAIPDYRLTATDDTVIRFRETPAGSPEAIRAWFYPGNTVGQSFVYPKVRAAQLAKVAQIAVPATDVDTDSIEALKAAPIVAITPDETEIALAAAMQQPTPEPTPMPLTPPMPPLVTTTGATSLNPASPVGTAGTSQSVPAPTGDMPPAAKPAAELPKTASYLPLVGSLGLGLIGVALGLTLFARRTTAPAV
jgi:hypothetical protein